MSVPEPARPLIQQMIAWLNNPAAAPIVHVNSSEPFSRYILGLLVNRAVYVRLDGQRLTADELRAFLTTPGLTGVDHVTVYLTIDEVDRTDDTTLVDVIRMLRAEHPTLRMILLGRSIPARLRRDPTLKGQITFIPSNSYSETSRRPHLKVRALGTPVVEHDGVAVTNWGGRQTRLLLLFCIDRAIVDRDAIFEAFWPGDTTRNATNVFHVTKLKVKNILGGTTLMKFSAGFYRIDPVWDVSYDVREFIDLVQRSEAADRLEAERLLKEAALLYQGDFLSGISEGWVISRRQELKRIMSEVLMRLAEYAAGRSDTTEAESLLRRSLRHDPLNAAAVAALVDLLLAQGQREDALTTIEHALRAHTSVGQAIDPRLRQRYDDLRSTGDIPASD